MKYLSTYIFNAFILMMVLSGLPHLALAQVTDTTGTGTGERGAARSYKIDTRATAMGDATVADPTNIAAININPALLSFVRDFQTLQIYSFQNWNNNLMFENATFPVLDFAEHRVAAQLSLHHMGFDAINPAGRPTISEPELNLYQVDLAYSFSYENLVSFGFMSNMTLTQSDEAQYWTSHTTLGIAYAPSQSVSYGISLRGLGRSSVYEIIGDGSTILGSQNLRESLELGASLQFPTVSEPFLSISFANEKRFGENGIWYKVGAEYIAANVVAIRSGMIMHPENRIFAPRFGLGVDTEFFKIEYAFSYHRELYERYHQIGILFNLN